MKKQINNKNSLSDYLDNNIDEQITEYQLLGAIKKRQKQYPGEYLIYDEVIGLVDSERISLDLAFNLLKRFALSEEREKKSAGEKERLELAYNYVDKLIAHIENPVENPTIPILDKNIKLEDIEKDPMYDVLIERLEEKFAKGQKVEQQILDILGLKLPNRWSLNIENEISEILKILQQKKEKAPSTPKSKQLREGKKSPSSLLNEKGNGKERDGSLKLSHNTKNQDLHSQFEALSKEWKAIQVRLDLPKYSPRNHDKLDKNFLSR